MLSPTLVAGTAFSYLLVLFAIAWYGDRRAEQGRSLVASPWVYALSIAVYCTAWTYFGSVGRAASDGVWFLPIYLGPMLAMILAWVVIRKMVRIARTWRITSVADFIASRYGKSRLVAGLVTVITVVGIVPYIALQLKAISSGYALLTDGLEAEAGDPASWWRDSTLYIALALAGFIIVFGTRRLDMSERHEGMVAAIAFESIVKLLAFLAVGVFVVYGLYNGLGDLFARAMADPELNRLLSFDHGGGGSLHAQWFALVILAMLSVLFLPRQFQVMVVENVDENHLRRAAWAFPLYLFLINLFVLPIALGGLLYFGAGQSNPDLFVLSLPMAEGHRALALLVFIGGMSAATGMVIVEAIAISTMICNDLVMPALLRNRKLQQKSDIAMKRLVLFIRRAAIVGLLFLGYVYFRVAGDAYALVSIGLISFAAVAQFAPAALGGMYWKGGTRDGVLVGLTAGFALWIYTLMLPSIARAGWLTMDFVESGPFGIGLLAPERLLGLTGLDPLTHSLFWSLLANIAAYVLVSVARGPSARETGQAQLFVDVFRRGGQSAPVFWRGSARSDDLARLVSRFLGPARAEDLFGKLAADSQIDLDEEMPADARVVQEVETALAGAIGSASARVMVASVVEEESLEMEDVMRILDEASRVRAWSRELEDKKRSLEKVTAELQAANEELRSLDRLKDDFMSAVTHELRTPLTSIRAMAEMLLDEADMPVEQRRRFLGIIVEETRRLSRLVGEILDLARIESGHAEWEIGPVDLRQVADRAMASMGESFAEHEAELELTGDEHVRHVQADADRLVQVLINLLSNALKHVPQGQGRVTVDIRDATDGVRVSVRDNGPGIAKADQDRVFEKFRQAGSGTDRPAGTGLGLPISRQIVEHFGGWMWLDSEPGSGACFGFFIPRTESDSP